LAQALLVEDQGVCIRLHKQDHRSMYMSVNLLPYILLLSLSYADPKVRDDETCMLQHRLDVTRTRHVDNVAAKKGARSE